MSQSSNPSSSNPSSSASNLNATHTIFVEPALSIVDRIASNTALATANDAVDDDVVAVDPPPVAVAVPVHDKPNQPKMKELITNINYARWVEVMLNSINHYDCLSLDDKGLLVHTNNRCWDSAAEMFYGELKKFYKNTKGEGTKDDKRLGTDFKGTVLNSVYKYLGDFMCRHQVSSVTYHAMLYNKVTEYKKAQDEDKSRKGHLKLAKDTRREAMDVAEANIGLQPVGFTSVGSNKTTKSLFTLSEQNQAHGTSNKKRWDMNAAVLAAGEKNAREHMSAASLVGTVTPQVHKQPSSATASEDDEAGPVDSTDISVASNGGHASILGKRSATPNDLQAAMMCSKDIFQTGPAFTQDSFKALSESTEALRQLLKPEVVDYSKKELDHIEDMIDRHGKAIKDCELYGDDGGEADIHRRKIQKLIRKRRKLLSKVDEASDEDDDDAEKKL